MSEIPQDNTQTSKIDASKNDASETDQVSPVQQHTGIKRIINAAGYSYQGCKACFKTEEAFRQEVYLLTVLGPLGLWLGNTIIEKILLVGVLLFVIIVELLNTAVERAIDRISFERHELSKESKDMGSAAVFFALLLAGLVWALVAIPNIIALISN